MDAEQLLNILQRMGWPAAIVSVALVVILVLLASVLRSDKEELKDELMHLAEENVRDEWRAAVETGNASLAQQIADNWYDDIEAEYHRLKIERERGAQK